MGYYRPGSGCEGLGARLRWYHPDVYITGEDGRRSWPPLVELLLHGTQSVVPPTIHPDTGQPYHWLTPDTLEDTPLSDLPELPADPVARLDAELGKLGLTRENPNGRARAAGTPRARPGRRARPGEAPVPLDERPRARGAGPLVPGAGAAQDTPAGCRVVGGGGGLAAVVERAADREARRQPACLAERDPGLRRRRALHRDRPGDRRARLQLRRRRRLAGAVPRPRAAGGDRPRRHRRSRGAQAGGGGICGSRRGTARSHSAAEPLRSTCRAGARRRRSTA